MRMIALAALVTLALAVTAEARPIVVAHRGMGKHVDRGYAENTIPSIVHALAVGAHMVEFDVRLTADGVVVLNHDEHVIRRGREVRVRDLAAAECRRVVVDGRRTRLPTLAELLDRVPAHFHTPHLNVEIKIEDRADLPELVGRTVALLLDRGLERRVVVSSFDFDAVVLAKRLAPAMRVGFLCEEAHPGLSRIRAHHAAGGCRIDAIIPERTKPGRHVSQLSARFIDACHAEGLSVGVYTVNDPAEMRALASRGLDFLITDRPERALRVYGYSR